MKKKFIMLAAFVLLPSLFVCFAAPALAADEIETYYRTVCIGGVLRHLQMRCWNATRGRWIEPRWITIASVNNPPPYTPGVNY